MRTRKQPKNEQALLRHVCHVNEHFDAKEYVQQPRLYFITLSGVRWLAPSSFVTMFCRPFLPKIRWNHRRDGWYTATLHSSSFRHNNDVVCRPRSWSTPNFDHAKRRNEHTHAAVHECGNEIFRFDQVHFWYNLMTKNGLLLRNVCWSDLFPFFAFLMVLACQLQRLIRVHLELSAQIDDL